jgi:ABC-type proline/glycine betaine transport system permease subunit
MTGMQWAVFTACVICGIFANTLITGNFICCQLFLQICDLGDWLNITETFHVSLNASLMTILIGVLRNLC